MRQLGDLAGGAKDGAGCRDVRSNGFAGRLAFNRMVFSGLLPWLLLEEWSRVCCGD